MALDFALPPRCPGCGEVTDQPHVFCPPCWSSLEWLRGGCARCGLPLEAGDTEECGRCIAAQPPFERMRSAVAYGELPKILVTRLKYGRKVGLARTMAHHMANLLDPALPTPIFVPVPLHRSRLWGRGFNQSQLIAVALARAVGGSAEPSLLCRTRRTRPLKGMTPTQRRLETRGAFKLRKAGALDGRRIVLVDDVLTTGSTAEACARALRKGGAARIELLTFARVVRPATLAR